uniref:fucolectin-4-like n=1 Tax=Centroberyx gerrardi TaxID=166262 RepID=UPI003AACDDDB
MPRRNVAWHGRATQSDLINNQWAPYGDASNAIDGNREPNFEAGSCSCTDQQTDPWWRVDLLDTYVVTSITITNRGDCCEERINRAEIRIGNSLENNGNTNPRCVVMSHIAAGFTDTFQCNGMEGRYVNIVSPGEE